MPATFRILALKYLKYIAKYWLYEPFIIVFKNIFLLKC